MKNGRYMITGCAGFIGSNLVKKIYKKYKLILVDDLSAGSIMTLPKKLRKKLIKKKIQDIDDFKIKKIDSMDLAENRCVVFLWEITHIAIK